MDVYSMMFAVSGMTGGSRMKKNLGVVDG